MIPVWTPLETFISSFHSVQSKYWIQTGTGTGTERERERENNEENGGQGERKTFTASEQANIQEFLSLGQPIQFTSI